MTGTIIFSITALLFWMSIQERENRVKTTEQHPLIIEYSTGDPGKTDQQAVKKVEFSAIRKEVQVQVATPKESVKVQPAGKIVEEETNPATSVIPDEPVETRCDWPDDTILDKNALFVRLSADELEELGIILRKNSMYYKNLTPGGRIETTNIYNWRGRPGETTRNEYYMAYDSDTACTKYRWGHPFYSAIDTLVPVLVNLNQETKILWFTPHASFFRELPDRFDHLESIYSHLKCLKRSDPSKRFVSYCDVSRNVILEEIRTLSLSRDVLVRLGFEFYVDSISLVHPEYDMHYNAGDWGNYIGSRGRDLPYPPNPMPVIITDEKGLKQNYFGHGLGKDFEKSMFEMLVPIKIFIGEYISSRDYSLIFWFYPTEEFTEALPDEIREEFRSERNNIIRAKSEQETTGTYFETFYSTLKLDDLEIFPNPASRNINIRFTLNEPGTGAIRLFNISGEMVKVLAGEVDFNLGKNHFEADISDISPGIYLVSVYSGSAFKTRRIIIMD